MEQLLRYFTPNNYKLDLFIDKHAKILRGLVQITGEVPSVAKDKKQASGLPATAKSRKTTPCHSVKLHSVGNIIEKVTINGKKVDFIDKNGLLTLSDAPEGPCEINIVYHRSLNENMQGAYLSRYKWQNTSADTAKNVKNDQKSAKIMALAPEFTEEIIVSTQFESHYARECFPCIDEPAAKATFDLTITVPDADDLVLANTREVAVEVCEQSQMQATLSECESTKHKGDLASLRARSDSEPHNDGREEERGTRMLGASHPTNGAPVLSVVSHAFATTPRMSTYLLAFVIGKFQHASVRTQSGITVTTYIPLNQDPATLSYANDVAIKSLDYYEDKFQVKYPLDKLDQVAIPDFEAGAMENWGLVTYRESCLLAGPRSSIDTKKSVAITIAHELSHQWFGNLVTMAWWDDLWLNESFASVMEYLAVDSFHPEYNIFEDFFTNDCLAAFRRDALPGVQSVKQDVETPEEIATLFDGAIVYAKGAHLIFMLMRLMGENEFFAGVQQYFKKYQYGNAVGDDLWSCLAQHADFDTKSLMDSWISRPGYPVIDLTGDDATSPTGGADGGAPKKCPKHFLGRRPEATGLVSQSSSEATGPVAQPGPELTSFTSQALFQVTGVKDCEPWPLPAATDDMSGHYLLNLSPADFEQRLTHFDKLNFEQKLRLLSDRILLAKTELVPASSLLEILPFFQSETSPALWDLLAVLVSDLKVFFDHHTAEERQFKLFLRNCLRHQLDHLGVDTQAGEDISDARIRSIVLGLAYYAEDLPTIQALSKLYRPALETLDPQVRADILAAKLYLAEQNDDSSFLDSLLANYQSAADPELKSDLLSTIALAQKSTPRLVELLGCPAVVRPQDHLHLFIYLRRNPAAKAAALDWLFSHWDFVKSLTGEKSIEDYPRYTAATIKDKKEADKFRNFFSDKNGDPVLKRTLLVAEEEIAAKLALIACDQPAVHAQLAKLLA